MKAKPKIGRPELPKGQKATGLYIFLTPARRAIAESIGKTPGKGIYALLDLAAQDRTLVARSRTLAKAGKTTG
jgi:hypothetical protein